MLTDRFRLTSDSDANTTHLTPTGPSSKGQAVFTHTALATASPFASAHAASAPVSHGIPLSAVGDATTQASFAYGLSLLTSGPMAHLDTQLGALYMQTHAEFAGAAKGFTDAVRQLDGAVNAGPDGRMYVTVDVVAKNGDGAALLHHLEHIGLQGGASFGAMASGFLPVDSLDALTQLHHLASARESGFMQSIGSVTTQAVRAEEADTASATFGVTGAGLKVGILSDSFNTSGNSDTMQKDIARGDLPNATTILNDSPHGTDEGRGMGQLVHDIATGAKIDFNTANGGEAVFAQHILDLAAHGDKVIVDDVAYFAELAYQDGVIAQAIDQVTADGVAYFSSAGNNGHEGLEQTWTSGQTVNISGRGNETFMRFASGQDFLPIEVDAAFTYTLVLQWDQPGKSAGAKCQNDLDLFLTDTGGNILTAAVTNNTNGDPVEVLQFNQAGFFDIFVGSHSGALPSEIKLVALGNGGPIDLDTTAGNFNDGTRYGHTAAQGAISVAAADYADTPAFGTFPPEVESFSSTGFVRFAFDAAGHRLGHVQDRFGPLFTAADGGDTSFFGEGDPDHNGHPNFSGTSAAAPDAAAVAALLLEADPTLTVDDIRAVMFDSCLDMDNPYTGQLDYGIDFATGAGLIQADLALQYATTHVIDNRFALEMDGTHLGDTIKGGGPDNFLFGLGGDDKLKGGVGGDTEFGGTGNDTFAYAALWDSTPDNPDLIGDLQNGDKINLSSIDADEGKIDDQKFKVVGNFDGHAAEAVLKFHSSGQFANQTTLELYTNSDSDVDMLILIDGNHATYNNFVL